MEESYLRNYLSSGNANNNVDIFEFIKKAITVAATDYPTEFRQNKDKIFETLYSCNNNITSSNLISQKEDDSQKESIPKTACDRPTIPFVYNRQGIAEVLKIKEVLDQGESESAAIICDLLTKLRYMELSVNTLEVTGIGKTVRVLRKHASKEVGQVAARLLKEWKDVVEGWLNNNNDTSRMPKRIEKTSEEKLEAVKRKLHQAYEDAENMKKKRRTQMLAFHQLPKKGLLPEKALHIKPRGHQLRRPGNNAIRSVVQAY
uniref:probable mediator of RNA polymerase II transcription subunit 26a n=1 Tax=Erigeron canadensis TaxID=72917 RepID=UPI001CB89A6F|nr:probable mediator of RNA polymerase II transcription subunit 26a [Erigeron canadensis]